MMAAMEWAGRREDRREAVSMGDVNQHTFVSRIAGELARPARWSLPS